MRRKLLILFKNLPIKVQRFLRWRITIFSNPILRVKQIIKFRKFASYSIFDQKNWIFNNVKNIAIFAYTNNNFYKKYYSLKSFDPYKLNSFDNLLGIPIVNKKLLKEFNSDWICNISNKTMIGNTGGTSGEPLKFNYGFEQEIKEDIYIDKIFRSLGCTKLKNRIVFRGLSLPFNKKIIYESESDTFIINPYISLSQIKSELEKLLKSYKIEYFSGYPTMIYELAKFCLIKENHCLKELISQNLKGILLGSEYPATIFRETIYKAFPVPSKSWYGHSERVILAPERSKKNIYVPYQSYGWCESISMSDGRNHLIGTDYTNTHSPFIRYDTEDDISIVTQTSGLLKEFKINDARKGEFILDKNGNRISLTAFIFGRHHLIFDIADYIQISQELKGYATIFVITKKKIKNFYSYFDLSNIEINFNIIKKLNPVKTKNGKIPLLVNKKDIS